tara:strand:+ start:504 stop:848 length:345 start_codon:yes stop_codon:yes gene_type:complete
MIEIKFLLLLVTFILFTSFFRLKFSNQLRIYEKIILLLILGAGIIFVINPGILFYISTPLKIGRGADLIFYFYIILSFWALIRSHIRQNMLEEKINSIASEFALFNPKKFKKQD